MTITELYHNGEMSYKYFRVIGGFCRFAERWERHAGLSSSVFDVDSTPFRLSLYLIVSVIVLLSGALSYCPENLFSSFCDRETLIYISGMIDVLAECYLGTDVHPLIKIGNRN